jgi:murein L,D-transpeptidase YcbB/YkuD
VRLEDAGRLAVWLFGSVPTAPASAGEVHVPLASPVPVYIIYLTAAGRSGGVAFRDDVYRRDRISGGRIASTK